MKIKISQYIDVEIPVSPTEDEQWKAIDSFLSDETNRKNLDFVIESVDDDTNHSLVDEIVG